jgi:hypothetical protein
MKNILEHIAKAREQAIKKNIRANIIIIDKDVAMVNKLWIPISPNSIVETPRMLIGLQVLYEENLSDKLGVDCNFVMADSGTIKLKTPLSEYSTDELLDEIRKRVDE